MIKVFTRVKDLRAVLEKHKSQGDSIGFVPTMGALHEGHESLLKEAVKENKINVLSIFVNPTQFGPNEDFSKYPRTLEEDLKIAARAGITYVFTPSEKDIYPEGYASFITVEGLSDILCGAFRPGHFRGVATVVHRLFQIVKPDRSYFGQKDLQQCLVIQKMVKDLDLPVEIKICTTVREADGLAKSSRNRYLSAEEREKSTVIFRAMKAAKNLYDSGNRSSAEVMAAAKSVLETVADFKPQYVEVRSLPNLVAQENLKGGCAILIAGYLGSTRLIDNLILESSIL